MNRNHADGSGWHGQLGRSRRQLAAELRHGQRAHQRVHSRRTASGGRVARHDGPATRSNPYLYSIVPDKTGSRAVRVHFAASADLVDRTTSSSSCASISTR